MPTQQQQQEAAHQKQLREQLDAQARLIGYETLNVRFGELLAEVRSEVNGGARPKVLAARIDEAAPVKRGAMSAEGKARIAAGQRKRWAAKRAEKAKAAGGKNGGPAKIQAQKKESVRKRAAAATLKRKQSSHRGQQQQGRKR